MTTDRRTMTVRNFFIAKTHSWLLVLCKKLTPVSEVWLGIDVNHTFLFSVKSHERSTNTLSRLDPDTKQPLHSFLISSLSCSSIFCAPSVLHLNKCHRYLACISHISAWITATGLLDFVFLRSEHWGRCYQDIKRPSAALLQMYVTTRVHHTFTMVAVLVFNYFHRYQ